MFRRDYNLANIFKAVKPRKNTHGFRVSMKNESFIVGNLSEFFEGLHDKDESNKASEALLSESSEVSYQGTQVKDDHQKEKASCPDTNPKSY